MTSLTAASATDAGRVRRTNQDLALVDGDLVAVADGMGGHAAGEVAASIAVEALRSAFAEDRSADGLIAAADEANRAIFERSERERELHGMGTTLTAAALVSTRRSQQIALVNVGDSRAYLFADGELSRLTEDHSVVEEMRRRGEISPNEAAIHPHRHILTRALGIDPTVEVDSWLLEARSGSRLLLCSDGLTNECSEEEIAGVLATVEEPAEVARVLVARALDHGGNDNITVVVADIGEARNSAHVIPAEEEAAAPATLYDGQAEPEPEDDEQPASVSAESPPVILAPEGPLTTVEPIVPAPTEPISPAEAPAPRPPTPKAPRKSWRAPRPAPIGRRQAKRDPLLTPRSAIFVVVLLLILSGIAGFVVWFVRASYFVGLQGNEIVIFQGRPGGMLWFQPTVAERTGVTSSQIFQPDLPLVRAGMLESSLSAARAVVDRLQSQQTILGLPTTTTTSSTTSTTIASATGASGVTTTSAAATTTSAAKTH